MLFYLLHQQILLVLVDSVATRMRLDRARACCVGVTVRDVDFRDMSHQKKFSMPTDITGEIFEVCQALLLELWNKKKPLPETIEQAKKDKTTAIYDDTYAESYRLLLDNLTAIAEENKKAGMIY